MKKIVALVFWAIAWAFVFCGAAFCADLTELENSLAGEAFQIKLESRMYKTHKEALDFLTQKRKEFFSSIENGSASQEALLAFENLFAMEQYHYMWEIDDKSKEGKDFIWAQFLKVQEWNAAHPAKERSDLYNVSACEIINSAMPQMSYSQKISLGLEEKKIFEAMLKEKKALGCLYLNAGLWRAFAPAIGGGSLSKAKEYFEIAAKIGPSDYEKFFGYVYIAQIDFKKGDAAAVEKDLQAADALLPGNAYIPFVRLVNKAGYDIFDYASDRDKVLSKVSAL